MTRTPRTDTHHADQVQIPSAEALREALARHPLAPLFDEAPAGAVRARKHGQAEDLPHATPLPVDFAVYADGRGVVASNPSRGLERRVLPTRNLYAGPSGGYVAVYTHDRSAGVYAVGADIFVAAQVRLRGAYEGRVFVPAGFAGRDISADPDFKSLCEAVASGATGGSWAGGDTGGWYGY